MAGGASTSDDSSPAAIPQTTTAAAPVIRSFAGAPKDGGDSQQHPNSLQVEAKSLVVLRWQVANADRVVLSDPAGRDREIDVADAVQAEVTPLQSQQDYTLVALSGDAAAPLRSSPCKVHVSTHAAGLVYSSHSVTAPTAPFVDHDTSQPLPAGLIVYGAPPLPAGATSPSPSRCWRAVMGDGGQLGPATLLFHPESDASGLLLGSHGDGRRVISVNAPHDFATPGQAFAALSASAPVNWQPSSVPAHPIADTHPTASGLDPAPPAPSAPATADSAPAGELEVRKSQRGVTMVLGRPSQLELIVCDGISDRPAPMTAADIEDAHAEVFAVCPGPQFDPVDFTGSGEDRYRTAQRSLIQYLCVDGTCTVSGNADYADRGATLSIVGDRARMKAGRAYSSDARTAIQTYPSLVEQGINVALHNASNDRADGRAAIGVATDGRVFIATSDAGLSLVELAQALIELGAVSAGYTDGGPARQMFVRGASGGLVYSADLDARRLSAFVALVAPRGAASSPSARTGPMLDALGLLQDLPTAELDRLTGETLDACSHRLDAWICSLAARRLETMRKAQPTGVHLGGYGWLEQVRPGPAPNAPEGYIHAPSLSQASTAAVLRNAVSSGGPDHPAWSIDLSSARVRDAMEILDAVRQEQPLAAVLGTQFEGGLRARSPALQQYLPALRKLYPLVAAGSSLPDVVDGLALRAASLAKKIPYGSTDLPTKPADESALDAEVRELDLAVQAVSDLLLAESVHQVVRGNHAAASTSLDAMATGARPPQPTFVREQRSGSAITHRVALLLGSGEAPAPGWSAIPQTPRSRAEPALDGWLGRLIGDPALVRCRVRPAAADPSQAPADSSQSTSAQPATQLTLTSDASCASAGEQIALSWTCSASGGKLSLSDGASTTDVTGKMATSLALAGKPGQTVWYRLAHSTDAGVQDARALAQVQVASEVTLVQLALRPLDLIALSRDGAPGLEFQQRILAKATLPVAPAALLPERATVWPDTARSLAEALELCRVAQALAGGARPLTARDLVLPEEVASIDPSQLDGAAQDAKSRADQATADCTAAAQALTGALAGTDAIALRAASSAAALCGSMQATPASTLTADQLKAFAAQVSADLAARIARANAVAPGSTSADLLAAAQARVAALFGTGFVLLPRFAPSSPSEIGLALGAASGLVEDDPEAPRRMLRQAAWVRAPLARLRRLALSAAALGSRELPWEAVQIPQHDGAVWIGDKIDRADLPDHIGHVSLLLQRHAQPAATDSWCGLLLDEWTETVPTANVETGVSFPYNGPRSQTPQAVLLAVPPDAGQWNFDSLIATISETLDLAHIRAVDLDLLGQHGGPDAGAFGEVLLPGMILPFNDSGNLPSFRPAPVPPASPASAVAPSGAASTPAAASPTTSAGSA